MRLIFSSKSWNDYLFWSETDKKTFKKLNALIKECMRTPFQGSGKPEPLKHELAGCWSRRIDLEHRLIYRIGEDSIEIIACRFHYQ
jgi:toxin YoeB